MDFTVGTFLERKFKDISFGIHNDINKIIHRSNPSILILGNSRARHHYIPSVIYENTGYETFNAGFDGRGILYSFSILQLHITRNKPKVVILDWNLFNGNTFGKEVEKLDLLLPYYKNNSELQHLINQKSYFEKLKFLSRSYPYNSKIGVIFKNFLASRVNKEFSDNGYSPLFGKMIPQAATHYRNDKLNLDQKLLNYFIKIINICQRNDIKLIVSFSPNFSKNDTVIQVEDLLRDLNIDYFNYFSDKRLTSNKYFHSTNHLNDFGAKKFTQIFTKEVLSKILSK